MVDLNQYEISRVLGSQMKPISTGRFGNFELLQTTTELVQVNAGLSNRSAGADALGYEQDRIIVQAFEDIRDGASTDALLLDRELLSQFVARSRELGLDLTPAVLNRRLLNVRKNKKRYEKHGIRLSPTTRVEPQPSIVSRYAPIIEFALVRLRYRYGVSIDDILLDPRLCAEYEGLAKEIAPELSDEDLRRAALYIRKSRFIGKKDIDQIRSLDLHAVENELSRPVPVSEIDLESIPTTPGLVEVDEDQRHLYIARAKSLRPLARQLATGNPFRIVAGTFWQPDLRQITLRFAGGIKIAGVSTRDWEHRLIHDLDPVLNWPMPKIAG